MNFKQGIVPSDLHRGSSVEFDNVPQHLPVKNKDGEHQGPLGIYAN